ncbi:hypothetical protein D3C81_1794990 [compost metagenome]
MGVERPELGQARHQVLPAERGRNGYPQPRTQLVVLGAGELVEGLQRVLHIALVARAGGGEPQRGVGAHEQVVAPQFLQILDAVRDRAGRDRQFFRRAREAAKPRGGLERDQQVQGRDAVEHRCHGDGPPVSAPR